MEIMIIYSRYSCKYCFVSNTKISRAHVTSSITEPQSHLLIKCPAESGMMQSNSRRSEIKLVTLYLLYVDSANL